MYRRVGVWDANGRWPHARPRVLSFFSLTTQLSIPPFPPLKTHGTGHASFRSSPSLPRDSLTHPPLTPLQHRVVFFGLGLKINAGITDQDRAESAYYKDFVAPKKEGGGHGHH